MTTPATQNLWRSMNDATRMAWAKACRAQGMGFAAMSKAGGASRKAIESWLRVRGVTLESLGPAVYPPDYPWARLPEPLKREAMLRAIESGARGNLGVGKALGAYESTVRKYALAQGITIPPWEGNRARGAKDDKYALPSVLRAPPRLKPELVGRVYPHKVHMLESRRSQCKFPTWGNHERPALSEMFYCGAPVDETGGPTSYCPDCRTIIRMERFTPAEKQAYIAKAVLAKRESQRRTGPKFSGLRVRTHTGMKVNGAEE